MYSSVGRLKVGNAYSSSSSIQAKKYLFNKSSNHHQYIRKNTTVCNHRGNYGYSTKTSNALNATVGHQYKNAAFGVLNRINYKHIIFGGLILSTISVAESDGGHKDMILATSAAQLLQQPIQQQGEQEGLINKYSQKVLKIIRYCHRMLMYALLGLPVVAIAPTAYMMRHIVPEAEEWGWTYMIWAIEQLGPTFIKLAQWASTRPDLYPPLLVEKLQRLQDDVKVHYSMSSVENTLLEAFGDDWKSKLTIDPVPLGAGCVAQVFKGIVKDIKGKSREVAVKLIHPHVESTIAIDMELLNVMASIIQSVPSLEILSLHDVLREFGEMMSNQLDLRKEAHNLKRFASKFKEDKWAIFPEPVEGFIKKNVLVETLIKGEPMSKFMNLKDELSEEAARLRLQLSDLGCRTMLKMIFFDNFVHGDLHPGNILVQFGKDGKPRLGILDCGIVYSAKTEEDHESLTSICLAFMKHDGVTAAKLMIDKSNSNSNNRQVSNNEHFCTEVQRLISDAETQSYFEHLGDYIGRVCNLARECGVRLDPAYFHVAMALKVVEGISLSLDRDLDLISKCIPIILKSKAMRALGMSKFPVLDDDTPNAATLTATATTAGGSKKR